MPKACVVFEFGSSPLARGTATIMQQNGFNLRFIPAGAGNRNSTQRKNVWVAVHPRWRGEQILSVLTRVTSTGSSPLARGTGRMPFHFPFPARFIPAGAGNSGTNIPTITTGAVHPRWRGEQARQN